MACSDRVKMTLIARYEEFRRKHAPRPVHGVWREVLAEFAGTFILIYFGCGSVAQAVLSYPAGNVQLNRGDILSINLGFALGALLAVFISGEASGAHLNPAITLPMVIMRRLPAWKFLYYVTAQLLGAFFGALAVYTVYNDAIMYRNPISTKKLNWPSMETAGIFATYPGKHLEYLNALIEQICATGTLSMLVLAITDRKNMGIPKDFDDAAQPAYVISKRFLEALSISLLILAIGVSQHLNSGYAINPARDLGPRLFTFCAGWGYEENNWNVFYNEGSKIKYWFWIPVVGPMLGGLLGAAVYHLFIGLHLSEPGQSDRDPTAVEDISDDQAQPGEAAVNSNPGGAQIP